MIELKIGDSRKLIHTLPDKSSIVVSQALLISNKVTVIREAWGLKDLQNTTDYL